MGKYSLFFEYANWFSENQSARQNRYASLPAGSIHVQFSHSAKAPEVHTVTHHSKAETEKK
jgi:hypothetical protein